jgi:hypothetical protein
MPMHYLPAKCKSKKPVGCISISVLQCIGIRAKGSTGNMDYYQGIHPRSADADALPACEGQIHNITHKWDISFA